MADIKFSQFSNGGEIQSTDIIVGLRSGINTQFTSPSSGGGPFLLKANNLSDVSNPDDALINLGSGTGAELIITDSDFMGGVYQLPIPCPFFIIVTTNNPGNQLRLPIANVPGQSFSLGLGPEIRSINSTQSFSVADSTGIPIISMNGLDDILFKVEDTSTAAGSWLVNTKVYLVNGKSGSVTIPVIVKSWNGSTTPVDVTAGPGIDITDGEISLTGSGASTALTSAWVHNNTFSESFTDAGTFKGIRSNNLPAINVNFVSALDSSSYVYFQYVGLEAAEFRIGITNRIRTVSNTNPNSYNYSIGIDSGSGFVPIYSSNALMPFVTQGTNDLDAVIVPYNITVMLNPNDKIYPIINNNGDLTPANNEYIVRYMLVDIQKVGDVGGASSGVISLNGLTGILNITSSDLDITPSGTNIDLSIANAATISSGLGVSSSFVLNISDISQSALSLYNFSATPYWGSGLYQAASGNEYAIVNLTNNTVPFYISYSTNQITLSSLTASQIVATDSSKRLVSLPYGSTNTASTLVQRDGSGNFSAGIITASLSGNATSSTTATTATNANNGATVSVSTNASFFPLFAASSSNSNQPFNLGTGLSFNPSTNILTTTGLTLSGLTSGSVIFSGTSGVISQDNTHLFYDSATGGHLYIGANSSSQTFQTPGVLNLYGTDGTTNNSLKFYTTADGYSGLSIFNDAHGNQAINFDSFWNGSNNISSYSGSNFQIVHLSNALQFNYASGVAQGSNISYTNGFLLNTSGDVVSNNNLIVNTLGKTLKVKQGTNGCANSVVLSGSTTTVNTTAVSTGDLIFMNHSTLGGTPGILTYTISNGISFTITSSLGVSDTGTVIWWIQKAA
jgi:hypothetical protein